MHDLPVERRLGVSSKMLQGISRFDANEKIDRATHDGQNTRIRLKNTTLVNDCREVLRYMFKILTTLRFSVP